MIGNLTYKFQDALSYNQTAVTTTTMAMFVMYVYVDSLSFAVAYRYGNHANVYWVSKTEFCSISCQNGLWIINVSNGSGHLFIDAGQTMIQF